MTRRWRKSLAETLDPSILDDPEHPFQLPFVPGDPKTYLLQRLVVRHVTESERVDPLFVEETVLRVLDQVAASAARFRGLAARPGPESGAGAAEVVDAIREILARRFREPLSLAELPGNAACVCSRRWSGWRSPGAGWERWRSTSATPPRAISPPRSAAPSASRPPRFAPRPRRCELAQRLDVGMDF